MLFNSPQLLFSLAITALVMADYIIDDRNNTVSYTVGWGSFCPLCGGLSASFGEVDVVTGDCYDSS